MGLSAGAEHLEMRINWRSALILLLNAEKCEKNDAQP